MASVLQAVQGSATTVYGIGTTQVTTQEGSWLAVVAGWNCVTPGFDVAIPAVNVTDSAGNLWQQAAITAPGTTASVRCAAWVAPNALPVSWVSVGLTGFAQSAAWTVAEISGMPQAAALDFSVGTVSQSGTAPSLTWIAQESGFGFAAVAAGNSAETAVTPAGWTSLGTAAAGNAASGCVLFGYLNTAITAGTATTAVALGTAAPYAYALCSLSATAAPPPQANLNFPLVVVEAAFDAQPGNVSASTDYLFSSEYATWTDITSRAIGPAVQGRIKTSAGRQYQLQQEETGTATIPLSNVDGAFTPTSPGSPYYSNALNANMSFQSGMSGWTAQNGASVARSPGQAFASGLNAKAAYSAQVTCGTAAGPGIVSALVPVNPNYPYSASAWVYSGTAISASGIGVGAQLSSSGMGLADWTATAAVWQGWTGAVPLVARFYQTSSYSYSTSQQEAVAAGAKLLISVQPPYNPVSPSNLAALQSYVQTLAGAGADCDFAIWHEPFFSGLTPAQYIAAVQYYGPVIRQYYPLVFVTAASSVFLDGENGYYPGDAWVDKVATDIYCAAYDAGHASLSLCAQPADSANPPKPFGLWEFNGSPASTGQTQAQVTAFFSYVQSYMAARVAAGQPCADLCLFSGAPGASWLGCATTAEAGSEGNSLGNWTQAGNCTIAPTTAQAHSGSYSMAMTSAASGLMTAASCTAASIATQGMPCLPGDTIDAAAWFRAAAIPEPCICGVTFYTSAGVSVSSSSGTPVTDSTTGWVQAVCGGVTAPATSAYCRLFTQVNSTAAAGEIHYADDRELRNVTGTDAQNSTTIEFAWDYRVALWETLYSALNSPSANALQVAVSWYSASRALLLTRAPAASPPVPAATWTQLALPAVFPPAGAAYAAVVVQMTGTPGAGAVFYVAEAALAAGPETVQTGLVTPVTPVRVTAWWQGRRYPVWMGYAQQWPQEWPDMPQWGFTALKAADALGVAAAGQMQSALIGEVLIDNPYAYLPCNETYTTQVNGATPSNPFYFTGGYFQSADANGLAAVNRASGNQITGTYLDGSTQPAATGAAINFLGDSGTGMGATGYGSAVTGQRGPSVLYADPALTTILGNGLSTAEFWFNWSGTATQFVTLLSAYGVPSSYFATGSDFGACMTAYASGTSLTVLAPGVLGNVTVPLSPSQSPQQCALVFSTPGNLIVYLNGKAAGTSVTPVSIGTVNGLVLGPGRYSYDTNNKPSYFGYNFAAGHLAVYPYPLNAARIAAHYQAGAAGWSGVDAATRFSQILTWGQLGLKRGGWNQATATGTPEITQISPAYSLSGQPAAGAVYQVAQSEGGVYGTQANGSLVYLERDAGYNLPVSAVLSDGTAPAPVVLNPNPDFNGNTSPWTVLNGALASSTAQTYGSFGPSALLTPAGTALSASIFSPRVTITPGGSYAAMAWVFSPAGYQSILAGFDWYNGSSYVSTSAPQVPVAAGAWTCVSTVQGAPGSGVTSAELRVGEAATPGTANTLFVAYAAMWNVPPGVPYLPKSSYGFDTTYVYNEVTATQADGPNQLALYDARGTASQAQYFRRSALTFSPQVVSPYDASDITTWSLAEYQQPSLHVSAVTVDAASDPLAAFPVILALAQGQVTAVNRNPLGGAPITETGTVERVQHEIGPGYWKTTCQMSPYGPAQAVLCADTPGFDAPGTAATLILGW